MAIVDVIICGECECSQAGKRCNLICMNQNSPCYHRSVTYNNFCGYGLVYKGNSIQFPKFIDSNKEVLT